MWKLIFLALFILIGIQQFADAQSSEIEYYQLESCSSDLLSGSDFQDYFGQYFSVEESESNTLVRFSWKGQAVAIPTDVEKGIEIATENSSSNIRLQKSPLDGLIMDIVDNHNVKPTDVGQYITHSVAISFVASGTISINWHKREEGWDLHSQCVFKKEDLIASK